MEPDKDLTNTIPVADGGESSRLEKVLGSESPVNVATNGGGPKDYLNDESVVTTVGKKAGAGPLTMDCPPSSLGNINREDSEM